MYKQIRRNIKAFLIGPNKDIYVVCPWGNKRGWVGPGVGTGAAEVSHSMQRR